MQPRYTYNSGSSGAGRELFEIVKAWLGVALAFTFLQTRSLILSGRIVQNLPIFLESLFVAAVTAGIAVMLHEYGHRYVARRFGSDARIIANDGMLLMGMALALAAGFLFFAPAAVVHAPMDKRRTGIIAAAGPVINMVLALLFAGLTLTIGRTVSSDLVLEILIYGYLINALLAVFNMLPFGPIDGAKVLAWSAPVFGVLIAIAALIAFGLPRITGLPRIF